MRVAASGETKSNQKVDGFSEKMCWVLLLFKSSCVTRGKTFLASAIFSIF
jgi:hypothetical protein